MRSSNVLGLSLGLHYVTLTQQKLESGSDDSGCVCKIKVCSIPEIFLYCLYIDKRVLLTKGTFSKFFWTNMRLLENFLSMEAECVA